MFNINNFCKNLDISIHNLKSWHCFCPINVSAKEHLANIKNGWLSLQTIDFAKKMSDDPCISDIDAIEMIKKMEIEAHDAAESWRIHY